MNLGPACRTIFSRRFASSLQGTAAALTLLNLTLPFPIPLIFSSALQWTPCMHTITNQRIFSIVVDALCLHAAVAGTRTASSSLRQFSQRASSSPSFCDIFLQNGHLTDCFEDFVLYGVVNVLFLILGALRYTHLRLVL